MPDPISLSLIAATAGLTLGGVAMSGAFSKPDQPKYPTLESSEAKEAAKRQRRAAARGRGRAGTILTGPEGLAGPAPSGMKTLIGE